MRGVTLDFSRPGKPAVNAFIESLNGKFRAECLNANWLMSLDEARSKCEAWCKKYNEVRPHSAIGNEVPIRLHLPVGKPGQPAVTSLPSDEAGIYQHSRSKVAGKFNNAGDSKRNRMKIQGQVIENRRLLG